MGFGIDHIAFKIAVQILAVGKNDQKFIVFRGHLTDEVESGHHGLVEIGRAGQALIKCFV